METKNYVKEFEEKNHSLIKITKRKSTLSTIAIVVASTIIVTLIVLSNSTYNPVDFVDEISYLLVLFVIWLLSVLMLSVLVEIFLVEPLILKKLRYEAKLFADNIITEDIVDVLNRKFDLNINQGNFVRKTIYSEKNWLGREYSFRKQCDICLPKPLCFERENIKYVLFRMEYKNEQNFKFCFDVIYPDCKFKHNFILELS